MIRALLLLLYISLLVAVIFVERKSPTEALVCLPYLGPSSI